MCTSKAVRTFIQYNSTIIAFVVVFIILSITIVVVVIDNFLFTVILHIKP